jgi:hypothetical protein
MKNITFTLPKNNTKFETYKKENLSDNVCETRSNPVSIKWNILDNSIIANTGLAPESMENWSDMFQVVDGELKEHYYIADLIRVLFKVRDNNYSDKIRADKKRNLERKLGSVLDLDMDTIIFTPSGKHAQYILKGMLDQILGNNYNVFVMNGGTDEEEGTTNAECEEQALNYSISSHNNNKKCIFITCTMGTRSWSNKWVKNAILMFNDGSFDMVQQKIARTFTPFDNQEHNIAHIVDFRLAYSHDTCKANIYIVGNILDNQEHNCGEQNMGKYVEEMIGSDKIEFINAYSESASPVKPLNEKEIIAMLETRSFINQTVDLMVADVVNELRNYKVDKKFVLKDFKETNKMKSTNIKGDRGYEAHIEKTKRKKDKIEKEDWDKFQCIKYMRFIFTNGQLFNVGNWSENVLKNIIKNFNKKDNIYYIENVLEMDSELVLNILNIINNKISEVQTDKCFNYVN